MYWAPNDARAAYVPRHDEGLPTRYAVSPLWLIIFGVVLLLSKVSRGSSEIGVRLVDQQLGEMACA